MSRINVSLDTLCPDRLARLSGKTASLPRVLAGLAAAGRAGFASLKLNAVVVRGQNEDELGDLARFAWQQGAIARFIELMLFGQGEPVAVTEVKQLLEAQGVRLTPDASRGWGPARHMRGASGAGSDLVEGLVGFIGAMTESFCEDCNRVRVGADGALRACLAAAMARAAAPPRGRGRRRVGEPDRQALLLKGERHDMAGQPAASTHDRRGWMTAPRPPYGNHLEVTMSLNLGRIAGALAAAAVLASPLAASASDGFGMISPTGWRSCSARLDVKVLT